MKKSPYYHHVLLGLFVVFIAGSFLFSTSRADAVRLEGSDGTVNFFEEDFVWLNKGVLSFSGSDGIFSGSPVLAIINVGGGFRSGIYYRSMSYIYASHNGAGSVPTTSYQVGYKIQVLKNGSIITGYPVKDDSAQRSQFYDDFGPSVSVGDVIEVRLTDVVGKEISGSPYLKYPEASVPSDATSALSCSAGSGVSVKSVVAQEYYLFRIDGAAGRDACYEKGGRDCVIPRPQGYPPEQSYNVNQYERVRISRPTVTVTPVDAGTRSIYKGQPERYCSYNNFTCASTYPMRRSASDSGQNLSAAELSCSSAICTVLSDGYLNLRVAVGASTLLREKKISATGGAPAGSCVDRSVTTSIPSSNIIITLVAGTGGVVGGEVNSPPSPPTIASCPRVTGIGTEEIFTFTSADPNDDRIRYLLYWDGETAPSAFVPPLDQFYGIVRSVASGDSGSAKQRWMAEGERTLVVRAQEVLGGTSAADPLRLGETSEPSAVCRITVATNLRVATTPASNITAATASLNGSVQFDDLQSELLRNYMRAAVVSTITSSTLVRPYLSADGKGLVNPEHEHARAYLQADGSWDWTISFSPSAMTAVRPISESNFLGVPTRLKADFVRDAGAGGAMVWFEWGRATDLSDAISTPERGTAPGSVSAPIAGLTAGSTYYFRAAARRTVGSTVRGEILSFQAATEPVEPERTPPTLDVRPLTKDYGNIPVGNSTTGSFFMIGNSCVSNCEEMTWIAEITSGPYSFDPVQTQGTVVPGNKSAFGEHPGGVTSPDIFRIVVNAAGPARSAPGTIRVTSNAPVDGAKTVTLTICLTDAANPTCGPPPDLCTNIAGTQTTVPADRDGSTAGVCTCKTGTTESTPPGGACVSIGALEVHTIQIGANDINQPSAALGGTGMATLRGTASVAGVAHWFKMWKGSVTTANALADTPRNTTALMQPGGRFSAFVMSMAPDAYFYQAVAQKGTETPVEAPEILCFALGSAVCPPVATVIDLGLRYTDGVNVYPIAVDALGTTPSSPLRVSDGTRVYSVPLVPASHPQATPIRFRTTSGVLALRKYVRTATASVPRNEQDDLYTNTPSQTAAVASAQATPRIVIPGLTRDPGGAGFAYASRPHTDTLSNLTPDWSFVRALVAPWLNH